MISSLAPNWNKLLAAHAACYVIDAVSAMHTTRAFAQIMLKVMKFHAKRRPRVWSEASTGIKCV